MKQIQYFYKCLFLLLLPVLLFTGCSKDSLVEKPKTFTDPSSFYKDVDQMNLVFAGTIELLGRPWVGYPYQNRISFLDTDQSRFASLNIPENHGSSLWTYHYSNIMNLNFVLKAINKGNLEGQPQKTIDEMVGMAKFLRGWNYHQLVRLFGDIPILTDATEDYFYATMAISRSPVKEVYNLIISDLQAGASMLPVNPGQVGHPNSDVAKAELTKVYLTMASYPLNDASYWSKAEKLAWEIIQDGRYSLVKDVNKVFSTETEAGPEMMWSFITNVEYPGIQPQVFSSMRGWGDIGVSIDWTKKFPNQPRRAAYVEVYNQSGDFYLDIGANPGIKKFLYASDFSRGFSTVNTPIIRFADVLLMYAEAANMANGGPTADAVWAVNEIIKRANGYVVNAEAPLTTTGMSKAAFDKRVINERNWELCFELGDRWFDLVRKRILKEESHETIHKNFSEDDYLFPIPEKDSRINPNLKQNPGYPNYN